MTNFIVQFIAWLNVGANITGKILLAPLMSLGGCLALTIISALTGLLLLIVFKYTSPQKAIGRARDDIKANLLTLKLYKDSLSVILKAQGQILRGAFLLLIYSIPSLLIMIVPVCLLLGQLSLWYQVRPLAPGEEAVITLKLNDNLAEPWPDVAIEPISGAEITIGPIRIFSKKEICWQIVAREPGNHRLAFAANKRNYTKELAVGEEYMRASSLRPGLDWTDLIVHPGEPPFAAESPIQSIDITYPRRPNALSGSDGWLIYFFIISMLFALIFRPLVKVRI